MPAMKQNTLLRGVLSTVLGPASSLLAAHAVKRPKKDAVVKGKRNQNRALWGSLTPSGLRARKRSQSMAARAFWVQEPWHTRPLSPGKNGVQDSHRALVLLPRIPSLISDGEVSRERKNGMKTQPLALRTVSNAAWVLFNCTGRGKEVSP